MPLVSKKFGPAIALPLRSGSSPSSSHLPWMYQLAGGDEGTWTSDGISADVGVATVGVTSPTVSTPISGEAITLVQLFVTTIATWYIRGNRQVRRGPP